MLWWSSVVELLLWTAGVVAFFAVVRWMLLDYVLDTLGGPPAESWRWRRQSAQSRDATDDSSSRARTVDTLAG